VPRFDAFEFTQRREKLGHHFEPIFLLVTMSISLSMHRSPAVAQGGHRRYSSVAIAVHWLLAAALFAQFALGWWMLDVPKSPPGVRAGWFNLHKSIGLSIALVVVLHLAWRATHARPKDLLLPRWQRIAARTTHGLLYACMLVMPLSGYLGSTFTRYPVRFFGVVLPAWNHDWPAAKQWMSGIHNAAAWLFMALIALHVAAALWHWFQRDDVAQRMGLPALPRS
jgi:cytochrome b561